MKNIKLITAAVLLCGSFAFYACSPEEDTTPATPQNNTDDSYTYTDHAGPIFDATCAMSGCHNSGSAVGSLEGYADAKAFANGGRLMGSIKHEAGFEPMPKNSGKLSDQLIETIQKWIDDGLKE